MRIVVTARLVTGRSATAEAEDFRDPRRHGFAVPILSVTEPGSAAGRGGGST